ncbi:MAG: hypothetical protein KAH17_06325 [Bacteroidales bacterium]|nr:hypothetical protein [Bacteroidales bacterium]
MKTTGLYAAIALFSIVYLSSCDIINPPEEIPAYIRIDTFQVTVDDFDKGSASHMITDIWMSVGGSNMGAFTMPFTIPTLKTGSQSVFIKPGIKLNGISASRIAYPFFKPLTIDLDLKKGEIHLIQPVSEYKEECIFRFVENFEDPGVSFIHQDYSDTAFITQKNVVKEGRSSGAIYLTEENSNFEAYIDEDFDLPENGSFALLEFDYKTNNGFQVGMYLIEDGALSWYGLVYVRPSDVWKRMYVDLGTVATYHNSTELYRISFLAAHEQKDAETMGEIYLDNIKIIHY